MKKINKSLLEALYVVNVRKYVSTKESYITAFNQMESFEESYNKSLEKEKQIIES